MIKLLRINFRVLLVVFITLLAATVTEAKLAKGFFSQEKADTRQLPEWYLNPPKNYTQAGATHIFSSSQGMSIERALANAIINLGFKLKMLYPNNQGPKSYDDVFGGKTSRIVNRTIDSIELFGVESVEWEETSDYTETFLRNFKITYQSGEDFYSIDLEEKAMIQLARSTGITLLASTGTQQFATEFEELGHGVFTYSILEGLSGKADGGSEDNKITVKELEAWLNDAVPRFTQEYKGTTQYPRSWSQGMDFPIGVVEN